MQAEVPTAHAFARFLLAGPDVPIYLRTYAPGGAMTLRAPGVEARTGAHQEDYGCREPGPILILVAGSDPEPAPIPAELWMLWRPAGFVRAADGGPDDLYLVTPSEDAAKWAADHQFRQYGIIATPVRVK